MKFSISLLMSWTLSLLLMSCSQVKLQDIQKQGRVEVQEMLSLLSTVENKEDMQRVAQRVKTHVENLTSLMIKAKKRQKDEGLQAANVVIDEELSAKLSLEMARLLSIEGVENILSEIEQESLHRLHAFDLSIARESSH